MGTITTREPEWSAKDRAEAIAVAELDADIGPHGIPMSEAMNPDNRNAFKAPKKPVMDWAAAALGEQQDAYYKQHPNVSRHGHIWTVRKKN